MSNQTEKVATAAVQFILRQFQRELKVRQLISLLPAFNTAAFQLSSSQLVYTDKIAKPKLVAGMQQEQMPRTIPLDLSANFRLDHMAIQQQQQSGPEQLDPQTSEVTDKADSQQTAEQPISPLVEQGVFALSQVIIDDKERQLESQISQIKKHLYFKRRLIKNSEDESNQRLAQILNRKPLQLPSSDFAYDITGDLLIKKKPFFKNPTVLQLQKTQDISQSMTLKKSFDKNVDDRVSLISRGQNPSRQGKRALFGNAGKRQLSHLPIIKLNQNTKLSESNRSVMGPDTSNYTLKSYQSRGDGSFKHYSEIEKEKSQRLYSLKRSSKVSEFTNQDDVEESPTQPVQIRKQSKRMQKYLKRLFEDKSKQLFVELNKSSNFNRLNSPHDYSVHRYYKYNFDEQKSRICQSSLMNLKINMSRYKQ